MVLYLVGKFTGRIDEVMATRSESFGVRFGLISATASRDAPLYRPDNGDMATEDVIRCCGNRHSMSDAIQGDAFATCESLSVRSDGLSSS